MNRHEIEDLIRQDLASKLNPHRGRAREAFDHMVLEPMNKRVGQGQATAYRIRNAILIGLLMIVCVLIGMWIPRLFPDPSSEPMAPTHQPDSMVESVTIPEHPERMSLLHMVDTGPARTDSGAPARRIREERLDRYQWIDPPTGGTFTYIEPSVSERIVEAHQQ